MPRWSLALLLLFAFAPGAFATPACADALRIAIVDWGVSNARALEKEAAPDTALGQVWVSEMREMSRTEKVETCLGARFGVRFLAEEGLTSASAPVTVQVTHPPFAALGEDARTLDSWKARVAREAREAGWQFEKPYELVPGPWTIAILVDGREAAAKTFTATKPEHCPAPAS
jgi:Domain of unknown function (DUF3859)